MRNIIVCLIAFILWSCNTKKETKKLNVGTYRAVLQIEENKELPFIFEVKSPNELHIFNAEETIVVDEVEYRNDSIFIKAPVFEGYIAATFKGNNLKGSFIKESLNRVVPFFAEFDTNERFTVKTKSTQNIEGIWETVFSKGIAGSEYIATGLFKQHGSKVSGTFRTTSVDSRYL